jgi:hypothetical protein
MCRVYGYFWSDAEAGPPPMHDVLRSAIRTELVPRRASVLRARPLVSLTLPCILVLPLRGAGLPDAGPRGLATQGGLLH